MSFRGSGQASNRGHVVSPHICTCPLACPAAEVFCPWPCAEVANGARRKEALTLRLQRALERSAPAGRALVRRRDPRDSVRAHRNSGRCVRVRAHPRARAPAVGGRGSDRCETRRMRTGTRRSGARQTLQSSAASAGARRARIRRPTAPRGGRRWAQRTFGGSRTALSRAGGCRALRTPRRARTARGSPRSRRGTWPCRCGATTTT